MKNNIKWQLCKAVEVVCYTKKMLLKIA